MDGGWRVRTKKKETEGGDEERKKMTEGGDKQRKKGQSAAMKNGRGDWVQFFLQSPSVEAGRNGGNNVSVF